MLRATVSTAAVGVGFPGPTGSIVDHEKRTVTGPPGVWRRSGLCPGEGRTAAFGPVLLANHPLLGGDRGLEGISGHCFEITPPTLEFFGYKLTKWLLEGWVVEFVSYTLKFCIYRVDMRWAAVERSVNHCKQVVLGGRDVHQGNLSNGVSQNLGSSYEPG